MRAYVMDRPGSGSIQDVPSADLEPYDVRVRMRVCGICNTTDKMVRGGLFPRNMSYPAILGHESVGEVVEVGPKARHLEVGQLITRSSAFIPGEGPCAQYWGGLAEEGVVRDEVTMVEDGLRSCLSQTAKQQCVATGVDPAHASLSISLSEAISIARDIPLTGAGVIVIGTGIAGLGLVLLSSMAGARSVTCIGRRDERLERARRCGADHAFKSSEPHLDALVEEAVGGGADVVFEASGDPTMIVQGAGWCRPSGRVAVYGVGGDVVTVDWKQFPHDVSVSFPSTRESEVYQRVLAALESGQIDADLFLTDRFEFNDTEYALECAESGSVVKSLILFDS